MSKSSGYFNKLNKIKKGVTWESSKKAEDKERDAVTKLQQYEEVLTQLESKVKRLEKYTEAQRRTEEQLKVQLTAQKDKVRERDRELEKNALEFNKYKG